MYGKIFHRSFLPGFGVQGGIHLQGAGAARAVCPTHDGVNEAAGSMNRQVKVSGNFSSRHRSVLPVYPQSNLWGQ